MAQAPDRTVQRRLCQALADAGGKLSREDLFAALAVQKTPFNSATYNAAKLARIVRVESDDSFRLTKTGRQWLESLQGEERAPAKRTPRKAAPESGEATAAAAAPKHAVAHFEPVVERSFRFGLFSDGALQIEKDGVVVQLTPSELQELQAQLRRVSATLA